MDIQLEKIRLIQKVAEIEEEWLVKALQRLLGVYELAEEEFIKHYTLKPMAKHELIKKALEEKYDFQPDEDMDLEEKEWRQLAMQQFFKGYAPEDNIYDKL